MTRPRLLTLAVALALAGCAVTQPVPPKLDLPPGQATAAQNQLLEHWWTAFNDPVLTALVDEALANNLDIAQSLARIQAPRSRSSHRSGSPASSSCRARARHRALTSTTA